MNEDAPTRRFEREELARTLAPFVERVPAAPRVLRPPVARPRSIDVAPRLAWLSWSTWLAALVMAGFALGVMIAIAMNIWQPARVALRMPPALPVVPELHAPVEPVAPVSPEPEPAVAVVDLALRRSAVDALLAGQTRSALEQYQSLLASSAPLLDRTAIERVAQVLERELRSCEQEAGTPCGF